MDISFGGKLWKLLAKVQTCATLVITGALGNMAQTTLDIILHLHSPLQIEDFVDGEVGRSLVRVIE